MTKDEKHINMVTYTTVLSDIKTHVRQVHNAVALAANKELILMYWYIGKTIDQQTEALGNQAIEQLAKDLQREFPGIAGFSRTNIFNIRAFYRAYSAVQQPVGLLEELPIFSIPWGHNVALMNKIKDPNERLWYAQKAIETGWSRSALETYIKSDLYTRSGQAITNFTLTLPAPHADIAQQTLKDPYLLDFLMLPEEHLERHLEQGLMDHIQKFLIELGSGFAFMGRQVHLQIDAKDYYIDLLFYHVKLRCYCVVELKAREFDPRDAGQIGFYLSAVDALLKGAEDKPTIGLILCKSKSRLTVEYALRGNINPIGVASYETKISDILPKDLEGRLPTVEEFEAELEKQSALAKES